VHHGLCNQYQQTTSTAFCISHIALCQSLAFPRLAYLPDIYLISTHFVQAVSVPTSTSPTKGLNTTNRKRALK
jgi:hypothetical protein